MSCKTRLGYHLQYVYPSDKPCYVCVLYASSDQTLGLATYLSRLTVFEMRRSFGWTIHLQEHRLKYIVVRPSGFLEERVLISPLFFLSLLDREATQGIYSSEYRIILIVEPPKTVFHLYHFASTRLTAGVRYGKL